MNPTQVPTQDMAWAQNAAKQGYSGQDIQNALAAAQPKASFLERALPTIGGIAGGLLGSLADPVVGPLGTIGGSAAGNAAGTGLEDLLTGKSASNLPGSALEGAVGGLAGVGGSKLLGGAAEFLGNRAAQGVGDAEQAAYMAPFKGIENSVVAKANDLNGTVQHMNNLGVAGNPQAFLDAASVATGRKGLGAQTAALDKIVADSGQLPSNGIIGEVKVALQNAGVDPADKDINWLTQKLGNITSEDTNVGGKITTGALTGPGAGTGQMSETVDPTGLLETVQKLDKQIAPYYNPNVNLTVQDSSKLQGLLNAKGALENTLYGSGIDKSVANYTVSPEDYQSILKAAGGNKVLADDIAGGINNAKTGADLRAAQAPYVQASKLGQAAQFQASGELPGTLAGKTASAVNATQPGVSPLIQQAASVTHPGVGMLTKLPGAAITKAAGIGSGVLGKVSSLIATLPPSIGIANLPNDVAGGTMNPLPAGTPANNQQPGQDTASAANENQFIIQAFNKALNQAPGVALQMLPLVQQALGNIQKQNVGESALQGATGAFNQAGGAQGLGGGLLTSLSGLIPGTAANKYMQEQGQAQGAIGAATGLPGGSIPLPSLLSTPGVAGQNLDQSQSLLSSLGLGTAQ
jgi:hypothetical protein